jgi:hypothetical protein
MSNVETRLDKRVSNTKYYLKNSGNCTLVKGTRRTGLVPSDSDTGKPLIRLFAKMPSFFCHFQNQFFDFIPSSSRDLKVLTVYSFDKRNDLFDICLLLCRRVQQIASQKTGETFIAVCCNPIYKDVKGFSRRPLLTPLELGKRPSRNLASPKCQEGLIRYEDRMVLRRIRTGLSVWRIR